MNPKTHFTHKASFYGIPCYYNEYTDLLEGRNKFYDFLLVIAVWIECEWPSNDQGFPIKLEEELK